MAVGQTDIYPRIQVHHASGIQCFFRANLGRAAGSHFAACHISDAGAVAERLQLE